MVEITVDGTDFAVHEGYVREWGTNLYYDPATDRGYQVGNDGQHVALTSYEAFGCDIYRARELADRWISKARRAWMEVTEA